MDNSSVFQSMLDRAIQSKLSAFANFDRTKNVQDQLQNIVMSARKWENHPSDLRTLLLSVCYCIENNFTKGYYSYEQAWLAYVMSELYSKRWNGKDWK